MNEQNGKNILERCDYLIINNLNFKQMKKKIFSVVAAVAVVAAAGWSYQQSKQSVELSDLAMENVEALATGEHGPDWDHHKLVYEPRACCKQDPYLDCSGVYSPCN